MSRFRLINESQINHSIKTIYLTLLERFGEPIGDDRATVGAPDKGAQGKALWDDEPKDRDWSDPDVVDE